MRVIIEKSQVKKIVRNGNCQEVFLTDSVLGLQKSLRIYDCDKDIGSMLKVFWGRCKSVLEIHSVCGVFPMKIFLDGALLKVFFETVPEFTQDALENAQDAFFRKLRLFLQNYPKKSNLEEKIFSFQNVLLRGYSEALFCKLTALGKLKNDLYQRKFSLLLDLLKLVSNAQSAVDFVTAWPKVLLCPHLFYCIPENCAEFISTALKLKNLEYNDEQIVMYLICMLSELHKRYVNDCESIEECRDEHSQVFVQREIDRLLLIQYEGTFELCLPWKIKPAFFIDEHVSMAEFRNYLSKQNW